MAVDTLDAPSLETLQALPSGVLSLPDLISQIRQQRSSSYVIQDFIPEASVNILVGDSGIGKSPLGYQAALCISAGIPFLGRAVMQGNVLYYDLENSGEAVAGLAEALCRHLGIEKMPDNLFIKSEHEIGISGLKGTVEHEQVRPLLVIIDSLRAYAPNAERDNSYAASFIAELRTIAREHATAFLMIHHIRKPGESGPPPLAETPTMTWLEQACGARALVNQTDVRVAVQSSDNDKADLALKYFARVRGDFGPFYLVRDCDDAGEPIGYRRMTGVELLFNPDQQAAYMKLGEEFSFSDAKQAYGRTDDPTSKFLKKCEAAGILRKVARGLYGKVGAIPTMGVE